MFSDRPSIHTRGITDYDAMITRRVDIHGVETNTVFSDYFQIVCSVDETARQRGDTRSNDDRIEAMYFLKKVPAGGPNVLDPFELAEVRYRRWSRSIDGFR